MKILYIANFDDIHSERWCSFFEQSGHEVHRYHAPRFSLKAILGLRHMIQFWKPDVLHAQYAGAWGLMGALCFFHPYVVTIHGSEFLLARSWRRRLVDWVLKRADLITTDSTRILKQLDPRKGRLIRFGVDVEKFKPNDGTKYPQTVAYRVGQGVVYDKETVMSCLEILFFEYKPIYWWPLENMIEEEMIHLLQHMDVYISTTLSDAGIASTTAEAMACELPCVVSDVAENSEWIEHGVNGFLFPAADHQSLAAYIKILLENPGLRRKFGERSRKIICDRNNWHTEMAKMEKLYKELADGKKGRKENAV